MAQPDISSILAALGTVPTNYLYQWLTSNTAASNQGATPQQSAAPAQHVPPGYPPHGALPAQPPPPQSAQYYPQPSNTGSLDLSAIRPINSGSVSIADAIAKAKSIAADKGVAPFDPRSGLSWPQSSTYDNGSVSGGLTYAATPRENPRMAGRSYRERSRSPDRREEYSANPYRDDRRDDNRRGNFRRSPSPDHNFRGSRDPPATFRQGDAETETIRVKSALVGLIIGRNGENLRKVESETGARVQFIQAKDSHQQERQCTISGSSRSREAAKDAIFSIVEENGGQNVPQEKGAYHAGMPGRAKVNLPALREGEASTQIMVPDKTVGLIIGRGGETIKHLQERSGCHVNIVGENQSVNGLRPINLIGSDQATDVAKQLILEIVESDAQGTSTNKITATRDRGSNNDGVDSQYSGGQGGGRDYIEKTIHVPSEAVGMIIGKGGETIKDMQRTSGCKINVNQPSRPDVTRKIDLAGTSRAMAEAERVIWEKVETVRERDAAAGRTHRDSQPPSSGYGGYSQQQQQQQPPTMNPYAQYMPQAQSTAPPQMPAFQMPGIAAPQPGSDGQVPDPYAQYGGQAAVYQWYAQQMANLQQGGQGGPPGGQ
ncbi:hypothetical protein LTR62_004560 [Meristemomyces frigidus]|uniref:K Homology domain-containing protein n=1 Tax=Meristemomyces frigidus TaxID=1508187 RepID=A0AAN7YJW7_9PEZI|nr:hypothetical protein LTR62_004560 [Meristemomyces frigidus]